MLSAGQFMAGRPDCLLVTVTAGDPPEPQRTPFDRSCGFDNSTAALVARRGEDYQAARVVCASPVHLRFVDSQYGPPLDVAAVADAIVELVTDAEAKMLLGPLGLAHPDHEATAAAVLDAAARLPDVQTWMYEELPARVLWPETVPPALGRVRAAGFNPVLGFCGTGLLATKLKAVRAYRSQLAAICRATGDTALNPVLVPERMWRIWPL